MSTDPEPEQLSTESPLEALERQTERAAMHSHTVDGQLAERIHALESTLYGLVDVLVEKRVLGESELAASAHDVASALEARSERAHGGVMLRVDAPEGDTFTPVNCAERMHVCKAICCRLSFPLTAEEVQSGRLKWELGQPYFIRHDARGACVHQDSATGACGVYEIRPGICRNYTCASDGRIWKDFEKMVLNHEWLEEHLGPERPQFVRIRMDRARP